MGNTAEKEQRASDKPSTRIDPFNFENPSFDPNYGFPEGRKPRVMQVSEQEMMAAKVPHAFRDYCAHLAVKYQQCRRDKAPFLYRCHHERHEYLHCEYEDYVLRMKEFERERRLRAREFRLVGVQ